MKMIKALIVVAVAVVALCAEAATWTDPETGIEWTYTVYDGQAYLGGGSSDQTAISKSTAGEITVPSIIGEYQVVGLLDYAFSGCNMLTSVILPNGIPKVSDSTFYNCTSLIKVVIPDSATLIGISAFRGCTALKSITIPNSVTVLWSNAFYGCRSLTNVIIPSSVTSIDRSVFDNCSSLTNITIPDSVTYIGPNAFYNCSSLNAVYITDLAKWCAIEFSEVTSNPLYYAGKLYINGKLIENLVIPDSVQSIESLAFSKCSSLTSVTIPDSVNSIKSSAFSGCSSLMRVTMSDGVTYIGSKAFSGCSLLTSVTIPDSVTYLGSDAFLGCNSLYDTVTIPGLTLVDGWVIKCDQSISGDLNLASIRGVGPSAFSGRTKITGLTIPDSVKSVGDKAFYNCKSLASVTIPNSVVCVGSDAFYNCNSLEAVYITDFSKWCEINFASEKSNPIYYADKLYLNGKLLEIENLAIPNSVTRIGSYVFKGYNSLKSVVIPDSVISIGASAFEDCSSLMSVTIGKNVVSIGLNAFPYNSILNMKVAEENSRYKTIYGQIVDNVEGGVIFSPKIGVEVISTSIREDEPTILDVTYVVRGGYDKVNIRALAFEDGTRSWAKVVRPETFVTTPSGIASVIGDGVRVSVTNTFSWKVSADYLNNLAKLKVEIFVQTDDLLPLDLMTIPAYNGKPALEFSRNTLIESDVMNALYWLYADKDSGLNLSGGILKNENITLVQSTSLNSQDAAKYVIQKMGYTCLTGENLNYINSETRLNLTPNGIRQYAVKEVE